MSKVNLDSQTLKTIYEGYRASIPPFLIIVLSLVLFFTVVLSNIQTIIHSKGSKTDEGLKMQTLKTNINTLSNLDDATLDSQLQILNLALPLNKDFQSVLDSLARISFQTGVTLGTYEFPVGNLSEDVKGGKYPALEISLLLTGISKR